MITRSLSWIERRLRPAEGWLPLLLLLAIVMIVTLAVDYVDWVPESPVVFLTGFAGLALAIILARRNLAWLPAWLLIIAYGLVVTVAWLGRLSPPLSLIFDGWTPSSDHIRQNWGLFVDRVGGWSTVVLKGGRSEETIVFAFVLGLLAWLLSAFAAWSVFRLRRPWAGLALLMLGLALNNYFGRGPSWTLALFVGFLVALVAVAHYTDREAGWSRRRVDYSAEIRLELLAYSGAIALVFFLVAATVPAINIRAISNAVRNQPAVAQAEQTLERVFAGVRQPGQESPVGEVALESGGGRGTLPRTFLLGAPPELYETVVMTATTQGDHPRARHWRGLSYDVYTGSGWAVSAESRIRVEAGRNLPLPEVVATTELSQTVNWLAGSSATRYTLGLPLRFDQAVTTRWRGLQDLSRVVGQGGSYTAASQISSASEAELRGASLAEVPPAIMARYTALPDSVPERVLDLARQVAGDPALAPTPYDQAKAFERFLRQYPYSLEVELPPAGQDPVDFFLFDQQVGYCDYYASAMVVLARSLGLPARLAAGYLAQPPTDGGVQTIMEINAHSWAELYFAGYGWLEFEPTAAFPAELSSPPAPGEAGFVGPDMAIDTPPPPIPEPPPDDVRYLWLLALVPLLLGGWWLWYVRRRERQAPADRASWAYRRLQRRAERLGQSVLPSQTPAEFADAFLIHLSFLAQGRLARQLDPGQLGPEIQRLTTTFAGRQYARRKPPGDQAVSSWRRIRWRLWLLTVVKDLRGLWPFGRA